MNLTSWKKTAVLATAALLIIPFAVACGGSDEQSGSTVGVATKPSGDSNGGGDDNGGGDNGGGGGTKEVEVVMTDNIFTPKDIKVPVNTTVKFSAKNDGTAIHNMHILSSKTEGKDFSSELLVNPGKTSTFEAKFTKKGVVDFQCDYHLPSMVGKIVVE